MNIILSGNKRKKEFNNILNNVYRYLSKYNEHSLYVDSHVKNPAIADLYKFSLYAQISLNRC